MDFMVYLIALTVTAQGNSHINQSDLTNSTIRSAHSMASLLIHNADQNQKNNVLQLAIASTHSHSIMPDL